MLLAPTADAAEINDKVLTEYYRKGKEAYDQQQWMDAIKFLFVYRELIALKKPNQQALSTVDGYIKKAEDALNREQLGTALALVRSPHTVSFIASPPKPNGSKKQQEKDPTIEIKE